MKPWVEVCSRTARTCVSAIFSFVLWSFWLALVILVFFQLYIITAKELSIPDFVLRRIEARIEEAGVKATFGRTLFDPAGRVLIENLRLSLPAFTEPIITSRSVFNSLQPVVPRPGANRAT
jgi:hypothetical protein